MSDLYAVHVAARPDDETVELDIQVVHPDAMHIPATPGFALMLLHDRASGDAPLAGEIDLDTIMDSGWASANACAFVESVELLSIENQPPPEALDDYEHDYWDDSSKWLKGRLRIRATHPAWISHLPDHWESAAFDPASRYESCSPAIPGAPVDVVVEPDIENSEGFLPAPRLLIASEVGPECPELIWIPRHGARAYQPTERITEITLAKLREWLGRPVLWQGVGEDVRVGIVARIEDDRVALVSISPGSRSTHYYAPEHLAWVGPAAFLRGTPRLAPPLMLEQLLTHANPAANVTQVDDREATIEIHWLAPDPSMPAQLDAADVLRLIAIPARTSFSNFDRATSKLGRTLEHAMEERELRWDTDIYPVVAHGFIESFEVGPLPRPRGVDLDQLERAQVLEFIEQRRWPSQTVRVVVSDPAWLEHLAGPWSFHFEDLEPAQDWEGPPIEWDPTLENDDEDGDDGDDGDDDDDDDDDGDDDGDDDDDEPSTLRRRFELPGSVIKLAVSGDNPRAVLHDQGLYEDISHPSARANFETACKTGNLAAVRAYVALGINLESHAEISGETPLIRAAEGDQPEVVRILAEAGVDLQGRDGGGDTAVMTAVNWGNPAVLRALLEVGADPNVSDNYANLPLVKALEEDNEELIEILLEGGASLHAGADTGDGALQWCVRQGKAERLQALLAREGADVNQVGPHGNTLLHLAVQSDQAIDEALLDAGAELDRRNRWGWTARDIAEANGIDPLVERLDQAGAASFMSAAIAYFRAISEDDHEAVTAALDAGLDVDVRNPFGRTGLLEAIANDKLELAQLLYSRGADINARDAGENNGLALASSTETRRWLLQAGIQAAYRDSKGTLRQPGVEAVIAEDDHQLLALLLDPRTNFSDLSDLSTCHSSLIWGDFEGRLEQRAETLRILGQAGADLEACSDDGTSLLMGYINRGFEPPALALIETGIHLDHADKNHTTALIKSCSEYSKHELQARITRALLAARADHRKTDWLGRSAWDAAQSVGNGECLAALERRFNQTLRDAQADRGWAEDRDPEHFDRPVFEALARRSDLETFLHWVRQSEHGIVRGLLAAGFDPNPPARNHHGLRPGNLPLITAISQGDATMVEVLLAGGADPNLAQMYGITAMSYAVGEQHVDIVRQLLAAGADPQPVDDWGHAPISTVASNGDLELLELLHQAGASVQPHRSGPSPLHAAIHDGQFEAAQWLLAHGADIDARQEGRETPLYVGVKHDQIELALALLAAGADPDVQTTIKQRATPLILATKKGNIELITALLAAGADPTVRDAEGQSAIDHAAYREELRALFPEAGAAPQLERVERELPPLLRAVHLGDEQDFARILAASEDPNITNYRGDTAMMIACGLGHRAMVEALLEAGADLAATNVKGDTAWTYAFSGGNEELRKLLEQHGAGLSMDALNQMASQAMRRDAAIEALEAGDLARVARQIDELDSDVDLLGRIRPLRLARERGDDSLVQLLLAKGADPGLA